MERHIPPVARRLESIRGSFRKQKSPKSGVLFRRGFSVFVDNVSKRIPISALKEAFECYGQATDVYIAYWNRKRQRDRTTFAFVRFERSEEASRAVVEGNNRMMDGRCIRVFADKGSAEGLSRNPSIGKKEKTWYPALKDRRSYKEALMGAYKLKIAGTVEQETGIGREPVNVVVVDGNEAHGFHKYGEDNTRLWRRVVDAKYRFQRPF
ncbi:hypothetical protein V6N11_031983 [Hibiscus sabdariffa]|uniref:RRM domain-containing protein n=1 Tax=Hibiscus sabdariffa TaxID=183260 RepID=A0ABR2SZT9_9ROSI